MTPERWQKVKEIFQAALERAPEQRSAFLSIACGKDEALRHEVESLLTSHEKDGSFIDSPAYEGAAEMLTSQKEFAPGQRIAHYEIVSTLGKGGMGEVYLAQDTKLMRQVALKILPLVSAGDELAQRRLLREAQTAATLDHPNICAIYEVGEEHGRSYIAMQYVDGETLDARLTRQKISPPDALNIAVQVADALAEAHTLNLVHRDIKPSNIMITSRGQAKVLDFGLAKMTASIATANEAETKSMLSTPGMIVGTVPYMSPEQVRGERVDARTDIFSFGVVLYEMLTEQRPFAHDSVAETIGAILHTHPPELTSIDSEIPKALEHIVGKCLAKNRERRYQSMSDVANDLRAAQTGELAVTRILSSRTGLSRSANASRWYLPLAATLILLLLVALGAGIYHWRTPTATSAAAIDSIAVLPLANTSNDQNLEYLSDGITDNLINNLEQIPKLKVMSRNSVFYYKGKQADAQEVGKVLGVRAVLKGEVRQIGDQLLINIELVATDDNTHIWGKQYIRQAKDVIATQNEIAQEVVDNLRLKLSEAEKQKLDKRPTDNVEAYKLYLKARFFGNKQDPDNIHQSIGLDHQALEKDPTFALAYSDMGLRYLILGMFFEDPRQTMPEARAYAQRALEIDSSLSDPHTTLGVVALLYDWDWENAKQELANGGRVDPRSLETFSCTAHLLESTGRTSEADQTLRRALENDPLSIPLNGELGCNAYYARQFDQAINWYRDSLKLEARDLISYWGLARTLGQQKRYQEAIAELNHVQELFGAAPPLIVSEAGYTYAKWGKREEARKIIRQLNEQSKQMYVDPYFVSIVYLGLGDKDQAMAWLEKAYNAKSGFITSLFHEPKWDELRSDPRFKGMMNRLGVNA
jgi:eukaryotic-like serine/threonine-protein kinase